MRNPFREASDVILDTEEFFSSVRDKGFLDTLGYFSFLSFGSLLINWTLLAAGITPAGLLPFKNVMLPGMEFPVALVYFIASFFLTMLFAGVVTRALGAMGKPTLYRDVYRCAVYGFTPAIVMLWIPVIGLLVAVWSLYMHVMGLGVYNAAVARTNWSASLIGGAVTVVFVIGLVVALGAYLISIGNGDMGLLWTVLIPVS